MVDLIPQEYRRAQRVERLLRSFGWAILGVAVVLGAAGGALAHLIGQERTALARFKQLQAQTKAQQARLAEVTARRDAAQRQFQSLEALRGGASIARLADAVDAALSGDIWFQELAFSRGGEAIERKAEAGGAGYFVVAAKEKRPDARADEEAWRTRERAEIRGVAVNHTVLAEFIKELAAQPEVRQVRLLDTSARNYPNVQVVDFRLAALLGATGAAQ
jgi:cell division protein FtsB